jgi:phosphoglycolate phosphatase-like HAD superfamily hydrolase
MHPIANYDVYIFDCDGVILDSNQLKIDAMQCALESITTDPKKVDICVDYFRNNFGRSRFHHVDIFIEQFLQLDKNVEVNIKQKLLNAYSTQCKALYLLADLTPGFLDFIDTLTGKKYIASGSEQNELRDVFRKRDLDKYFDDIYGSPTKKSDLVSDILVLTETNNAIMFGDAISDLEAAQLNNIDFIAYIPFSNVAKSLADRSVSLGCRVTSDWIEI